MKNYFYKYLLFFGIVKERRSLSSMINRTFIKNAERFAYSNKAINSLHKLNKLIDDEMNIINIDKNH